MTEKISDVGKPFHIAAYALPTMMVAQVTRLTPGDLVYALGGGDPCSRDFEQAKLHLTRTPKSLPVMIINPEVRDIPVFRFDDFAPVGHQADQSIKTPVAV